MNVVFFDDRSDAAHGAQRTLISLARCAQEAGHRAQVATTRTGAFTSLAARSKVRYELLGESSGLAVFGGELKRPSPRSALKALLSLVVQNWRLRALVVEANADVLWVGNLRSMMYALLVRMTTGCTVVWYVQNLYGQRFVSELAWLIADRIIVGSSGMEGALGAFYRWRPGKVEQLHSGVEVGVRDRQPLLAEHLAATQSGCSGCPDVKLWAIFVGSLTREKGVHRAIELLKNVDAERLGLLVVGERHDMDYFNLVESQAARLPLHTHFLGFRPDADVLIGLADVLVLLSTREGLPLTVLTALRSGTVPIVTDVGGMKDAVVHGKNGVIIQLQNDAPVIDAWAIDVLSRARTRQRLASNGRSGGAYWSVEAYNRRFLGILDSIQA